MREVQWCRCNVFIYKTKRALFLGTGWWLNHHDIYDMTFFGDTSCVVWNISEHTISCVWISHFSLSLYIYIYMLYVCVCIYISPSTPHPNIYIVHSISAYVSVSLHLYLYISLDPGTMIICLEKTQTCIFRENKSLRSYTGHTKVRKNKKHIYNQIHLIKLIIYN